MHKKFLFVAVTAFCFLAACNSNSSDTAAGDDPKAVLTHFLDALSKKDMVAVKKYVTKDSEGMVNMMQMSMKNTDTPDSMNQFDPSKINIGEPVINGNEAQVPVSEKGRDDSVNFILQKEDGAWKVAFNFDTMLRMAKEKMKEKGMNPENIDSMMQSVPKEEIEKAQKMLDSLSKNMKGISADKMEEAKKMLDSISKTK